MFKSWVVISTEYVIRCVRSLPQILCLSVILLPFLVQAQGRERRPRYEFVKANDKPKFLKQHKTIEIYLKDSLPQIPAVNRSHMLRGNLLFTTSDSIGIDCGEERWAETRWDGIHHPAFRRVNTIWNNDTTVARRSVSLDRVDYVEYERATAGAGAFLAMVSAAGLLIYAPLKAMKFKNGTFDGDQYIRVATPCLIGVGVGLVVMPFTEGKQRVRVKLGT